MRKIIIKNCPDCGEKFFTGENLPWRKGDSLCKGCLAKRSLEKIFPDWENYFKQLPENLSAVICLVAEIREKAETLEKDLSDLLEKVAVPDSIMFSCELRRDNLLKGADEKMVNFYRYELKKFICGEKNRKTMELIKKSPLIQRFPDVLREIKERYLETPYLLDVSSSESENELKVWGWSIGYEREQKGRVEIRIGHVNRLEEGRHQPTTEHQENYFNIFVDSEGGGIFNEYFPADKVEELLRKLGLKSYRQLQGRKVYYQLSGKQGKLLEII